MKTLRKHFCRLGCWLGLSLGALSSTAQAEIIMSIDHKLALPGETVLIGVYASSNIGDIISGFNLPMDFNVDGFVDVANDGISDLPSGFALNAFPLRNQIYANTGLDRPQPQLTLIAVDAIPTGSGNNVVLGPNPTKLFDIAVNVSGLAKAGDTMPIVIKLPDAPLSSLFNVAGPNNPSVALFSPGIIAAGSITVVPEPATLGLVALGASAGWATGAGVRGIRIERSRTKK